MFDRTECVCNIRMRHSDPTYAQLRAILISTMLENDKKKKKEIKFANLSNFHHVTDSLD